jgi:hypothetical protein
VRRQPIHKRSLCGDGPGAEVNAASDFDDQADLQATPTQTVQFGACSANHKSKLPNRKCNLQSCSPLQRRTPGHGSARVHDGFTCADVERSCCARHAAGRQTTEHGARNLTGTCSQLHQSASGCLTLAVHRLSINHDHEVIRESITLTPNPEDGLYTDSR